MLSRESKPLKKPSLGPPDVYLQHDDQKEDQLSSHVLKVGYPNEPVFSDEHGTAAKEVYGGINQPQVINFFNNIISKKTEHNTLNDGGKKRQQIVRDNFLIVTSAHRTKVESWMDALCSGSRSLSHLAKKVPIFPKKEDIFQYLYDYNIPLQRAAWYLKMTAAYFTAQNEMRKQQRRHINDPASEWTQLLTKCMREYLQKLIDHSSGGHMAAHSGFLTTGSHIDPDAAQTAMKQWGYCDKLALHLYEEGLLDRQEYLNWCIELLDKLKTSDENILKMLLLLVFQYIKEIVKQYLLSRRLAQFCCKKLSQMTSASGYVSPRSPSPHFDSSGTIGVHTSMVQTSAQSALGEIWSDFTQCYLHRSIVHTVSAMVQSIIMCCPSALVWLNLGEGKSSFIHSGSPLDLLPCHPCLLPMPPGEENVQLRRDLRDSEIEISRRSMAAELSWSSDKVQKTITGFITSKLLCVLDILDRHNFDKAETSPAIDQLYRSIFSIWNDKASNEPQESLEPLVFLLCEWSITVNRLGDHRGAIVARLLDKHQTELWNSADSASKAEADKADGRDENIFHDILFKFLHLKAPVLDDSGSAENHEQFRSLAALFGELIRMDIFSHDAYVCTLISRGDLSPATYTQAPTSVSGSREQNREQSSVLREILEADDDRKSSPEQNPSSVLSELNPNTPGAAGGNADALLQASKQSRHLQYVTHFPLPQEENFTHESNQRSVTLFGVGKGRLDNGKGQVRRLGRELVKLFSRRYCIDVNIPDAGRVKQKAEPELDQILQRFQALPYYDQYALASSTMEAITEVYESFQQEASTLLPLVEHVMFFLDLVETSHNINSLIDFCEKLVLKMNPVEKRIAEVEAENKMPMFVGKYTQHLTVYMVGVMRCHLPSLLLDPHIGLRVFNGLVPMVAELRLATECSSAQRCILLFLYILYSSSYYMQVSEQSPTFKSATQNIRDQLLSAVVPSNGSAVWNKDAAFTQFQSFNIYKFRYEVIFNRRMTDNKTSFVCNAILYLSQLQSFEKVNEVALMCCEFTACCSALSSEWLGVIKALCCSSDPNGYTELIMTLNVNKLGHQQLENLAVFVSMLIARHCFSLDDFLVVAVTSLTRLVTSDQGGEGGARLTLYILTRMFKSSTQLAKGLAKRSEYIKSSCDLHLMTAAKRSIQLAPLLAVLKAIYMLASKATSSSRVKDSDFVASLGDAITDEEDEDDDGILSSRKPTVLALQAKQVLTDICREDWVREKFLQYPEKLLQKEMLLDNWLESQGGWRLVQLICRRHIGIYNDNDDIDDDSKQQGVITRILRSLDQWTLRVAWLELQLMYVRHDDPNNVEGEMSLLLDNIARATIEVFHSYSTSAINSDSADGAKDGVWLVAPFIAKLPTQVQGRVLRSAALVLENSNRLWQLTSVSKQDKEKESSMSLLNHQPFLSLILTCLKGHDEQRETIITSLQSQLQKFVTCAAEDQLPTEPHQRQTMLEALQLRLSLVGGMFDTIQRTHIMTSDWAHLFHKLIYHGIVDVNANSDLYYTVLDMLSALIHSTLVSDSADSVENNKKPYQVLIKKIKKDMGDKKSDSLHLVRQLLPLPKVHLEVIACEAHGSLLDAKGNKIQGFEFNSKKQGLQVSNKHKISPWELLEGFKNPAPLSYQWFGGVKMEKKLLSFEEQGMLMLKHEHTCKETDALAPPVLPNEDMDASNTTEDEQKVEGDPKARALASQLPQPKAAASKTQRRRPSRSSTTVSKAGAFPVPAVQRYDRSMPATPGVPPVMPHSGWTSQAPRGPNPPSVSYTTPDPYYVSGQGQQHNVSIMQSMAGRNTKRALGDHIIKQQQTRGGVSTPMMVAGAGHPAPPYGSQMDTGPSTSSEQLRKHVLSRQGRLGGMGEYEQAPPQYQSQPLPQYRGMSGHQGYHQAQPPSYGAQSSMAPSGGMLHSGGSQQGHPGMMQYSGNPNPSTIPRYQQAGQAYSGPSQSVQGMTQGISQGMSQGIPQGMPQGMAPGISQGMSQGMPQGMSQGMPQGMSQGMAQGMSQGMPQGMSQGMAQGMSQGMAQGMSQGISQSMSQGISQGMPQGISQGMPQGIQPGMQQQTLQQQQQTLQQQTLQQQTLQQQQQQFQDSRMMSSSQYLPRQINQSSNAPNQQYSNNMPFNY